MEPYSSVEESIVLHGDVITAIDIPVRITLDREIVGGRASSGQVAFSGNELTYTPDAGFVGDDQVAVEYTGGALSELSVQVFGYGLVVRSRLYQVIESAHPPDAPSIDQVTGYFWIDANNNGDAIGDYGAEDGSKLFVRWADGTYEWIVPPDASGSPGSTDGFHVVGLSGMNDEGVVTGWYFNDDYTVAGTFLWSHDSGSIIDASAESRDQIANSLDNAGTVVGYTEDYDEPVWSGWIAPAGSALGDAKFVLVDGWVHTQLFEIDESGTVLGAVGDGFDAWDRTAPRRCFTGDPLTDDYEVLESDSLFHADCRGLNDLGQIVGFYLAAGQVAPDYSAMMWDSEGMARIGLPMPTPEQWISRREELLAITNDGRMFGNIVYGSFDSQLYVPFELVPLDTPANHTFDDTRFDWVTSRQ